MTIDRILWLIAAICFAIGGLRAMFPKLGARVDWMLMGFAFIALTFVF